MVAAAVGRFELAVDVVGIVLFCGETDVVGDDDVLELGPPVALHPASNNAPENARMATVPYCFFT